MERIDHCSDRGEWTLWRQKPSAALSPYIAEIQGFREACDVQVKRTELPTGSVPMIIVLGQGFALRDESHRGGVRSLNRTFLAGLHQGPATVGSAGQSICMQVDFLPLGARRFLRMDLEPLRDCVVDLAVLDPTFADELEGRLIETCSWQRRFRILEYMLAQRILSAPAEDPRVVAAWRTISGKGGQVRIDQLAQSLDLSRKHLNALFRQQIGATPKAFARLVRFSKAVNALQSDQFAACGSLADLALRCGYSDQSHFNREFSAFSSETPSALIERILPDGTGIIAR